MLEHPPFSYNVPYAFRSYDCPRCQHHQSRSGPLLCYPHLCGYTSGRMSSQCLSSPQCALCRRHPCPPLAEVGNDLDSLGSTKMLANIHFAYLPLNFFVLTSPFLFLLKHVNVEHTFVREGDRFPITIPHCSYYRRTISYNPIHNIIKGLGGRKLLRRRRHVRVQEDLHATKPSYCKLGSRNVPANPPDQYNPKVRCKHES